MQDTIEELTLSKSSINALYHILRDDKLLSLLVMDKIVAKRVTIDKYGVVRIYKYQSRWWSWIFGEYKSFDFTSLCMNIMSIIAETNDSDEVAKKQRLGMILDWINASIDEKDFNKATYLIFTYWWFQYKNLKYRSQILNQKQNNDVSFKEIYSNDNDHEGCRIRRTPVNNEEDFKLLYASGMVLDSAFGPVILGADGQLYEVSKEYLSLLGKIRHTNL